MVDTFLSLLMDAASHPMLGEQACYLGTATGGSTTKITDTSLVTYANDESWLHYYAYLWSTTNNIAGSERFLSSVDLSAGDLNFSPALSAAVASGDQYLLLRDFRWRQWLQWANETAKSLYFEKHVYQRGLTNLLRYTLPTPLSYGGWVEDVKVGDYPFAFSDEYPRSIRWYRLNPLNIEGDVYLVLQAALSANRHLLFEARVPYLHPSMSAYTFSRSVLVPFGETAAVSPPRQMLVAGMVWRALRAKVRNLTGQARADWLQTFQDFSREYALLCRQHGVAAAGITLGYGEDEG